MREVDFVICEDTRVTGHLLSQFDIKKELISANAFSEKKKIDFIIERLSTGLKAGLVSDAGTPSISDPGSRLISVAIRKGIPVVPVPGVSAVITALSISGLRTDAFVFEGFPPQKKGRQKFLSAIANEERTVVLYESVYRIEKLMKELEQYIPVKQIAVCKELTKLHEEVWRGTPSEILAQMKSKTIKGEYVVVIGSIAHSDESHQND